MNFNLTKEQKNEIMNFYGGSIQEIETIEFLLNELVVKNVEDFVELVININSQLQSIKDQIEACVTKNEEDLVRMSLEEIVTYEYSKKYPEEDVFEKLTDEELDDYLEKFY